MSTGRRKTGLGFYAFWLVSFLGIAAVSFVFFYLGVEALMRNSTNEALLNLLMGFAGTGIAVKVAHDMFRARKAMMEEEQEVFTELSCPECGRKVIREFRDGEFVGGIVDDRCPRCGVPLLVVKIYTKAPKKEIAP